jgi:2-C-methyl-D-erythritol 4-phosphate cytidylyltransferase
MSTVTKAIVLAGGLGVRFSEHYIPKQFIEIDSKPVLAYTLENVQQVSQVDGIILVVHNDYEKICRDIIRTYGIGNIEVVYGGATRQESIYAGLQAARGADYVIVQNGVCPLTSPQLIEAVLRKSQETRNVASAYIEVVDTIAFAIDGVIDSCLDKSRLVKLQAPQACPYSVIMECHERAIADGLVGVANDAILVAHYGHRIHLVHGAFNNIKVTTTEDWLLVRAILEGR